MINFTQIPLKHMTDMVEGFIHHLTGQRINIVINMDDENNELNLLCKAYQTVCDHY